MSWGTARLGDVVKANPRIPAALRDAPPEQVSFVPMASVSETGVIVETESRSFEQVRKGYRYFEEGDVLIAKITPCMENGKAAEAVRLPHRVGFGSTEFHVLRPGPKVHRRFLFYFIWNAAFRREARRHMAGAAGQKRVPTDYLRDLDLPLPPLDEQRRIAAVLDKADALRRQRQQSLQLTDQLLQSIFLDMFGDPATNPKGWDVMKSACLFADKPRLGTMRPAGTSGYLVVRVGELGQERVCFERCGRVELDERELRRFSLLPGDTLLARAIGSQAQLGKCSFFAGHVETVVADSHVMRLRPDPTQCDPYWFYFLLSAPFGRRLIQDKGGATAVQFNINSKQASDLDIPLPPMELQLEFVRLAGMMREQSVRRESSAKEGDRLFSSLQQRAFRGELDLSKLELEPEEAPQPPATTPSAPGRRRRRGPNAFVAPPEIERRLRGMDKQLADEYGDGIEWSEEYFKYRILGRDLSPPFGFDEIWDAVSASMPEARYDTVRGAVFGYLEGGTLEQAFDEERREIAFRPRGT